MTDKVEAIPRGIAPASAENAGTHDLATRLAGIAGYVARLPRGERAELRRLRRDGSRIPPEVFWRIVDRYDIRPADEPFWLAVMPLMVQHAHEPRRKPGHVLEAAGVTSARLERWLRLGRDTALREADRLLSRVDSPFDWVRFGFLLHGWSDVNRRRLARDFFLVRERRVSNSATEGGE